MTVSTQVALAGGVVAIISMGFFISSMLCRSVLRHLTPNTTTEDIAEIRGILYGGLRRLKISVCLDIVAIVLLIIALVMKLAEK